MTEIMADRNVAEAFIDKYKDIAIEHQIKYGIPASVTLAQACLESAYGTSDGVQKHNVFFGIKADKSWKGGIAQYWDDEAGKSTFRAYPTPEASFSDHSRLLTNNHYKNCCGNLSADNHVGWLYGIVKGGYATDAGYVEKNESVIRNFNLDQYDKIAMQKAKEMGKECGYLKGDRSSFYDPSKPMAKEQPLDNKLYLNALNGNFAVPIDLSKVEVSSEFNVQRPGHKHGGIDLSTKGKYLDVYATEDNGKVVAVKPNNGDAGNMVTIEYNRSDGSKYQTTYMHLSEIKELKKGDPVQAGQIIGKSGNTGHSTGPHLHFEVYNFNNTKDGGKWEKMDPAYYLAEMEVRSGNTSVSLNKNGNDYLAETKSKMQIIPQSDNLLAQKTNSNNPNKWLNYLMQQTGTTADDSQDPITSLISCYFTGLIALMARMKNRAGAEKEEAEQKALAEKNSPEARQQRIEERDRNTPTKEYTEGTAHQTASMKYEELQEENTQSVGLKKV